MKKILISIVCIISILFLPSIYEKNDVENTEKNESNSVAEQNIGSQFRSDKFLDQHYDKHVIKQAEFGDISKEEYLSRAQNFVDNPPSSVLTKTEEDGDTLFYNEDTNEFAVKSKDGYIRTYFKPSDGINYFNRQ